MEIQNITGVGAFQERMQVNNNQRPEPAALPAEQNIIPEHVSDRAESNLDVYA